MMSREERGTKNRRYYNLESCRNRHDKHADIFYSQPDEHQSQAHAPFVFSAQRCKQHNNGMLLKRKIIQRHSQCAKTILPLQSGNVEP